MQIGKAAVLVMIGAVLAAGCNGTKPIPKEFGPRIPVQGKVTLAGKPLLGGNVTFYSLDHDVNQLQPYGIIDEQGNYSLSSYQEQGAPAGKYRVTVDPGSDDKKMDTAVDAVYSNWEKSPLIVTVLENAPPGAYDLKMEILRKKR